MANNEDEITFESLENTDTVTVDLVPERKGLILKHCEYYVSSRRHGTTVTRRYNEFVQLYDVLFAKYQYRVVCRLPPKRVVVGGGSASFLQRRRAALQRWLTLVARHPILSHDADTRAFLCEPTSRLERPRFDEFTLAGTREPVPGEMTTDEMQAAFVSEQEQLRLVQLGLCRLFQIFEKVEARCVAEHSDIRELGAALSSLAAPSAPQLKDSLQAAAHLISELPDALSETPVDTECTPMLLALDALTGYRELCARLTRGLHAERVAAATSAPHNAASQLLRDRHRYALKCSLEEARVARAYALRALHSLPDLLRTQATAHAREAALWADLHTALRHPHARQQVK
ncbi:Sorting nexin-8 [Eumeta japonica]|uniref:Sorting nexin-8 n=1 Tax=Eumeta variegata TaxID=151549 RepID=A0A4C1VMG3_EUMVA|nr:Sorting nexin-8 [Eumeta japonica]